jgi:hypothetical protein
MHPSEMHIGQAHHSIKEKIQNAYLLFYERVLNIDVPDLEQITEDESEFVILYSILCIFSLLQDCTKINKLIKEIHDGGAYAKALPLMMQIHPEIHDRILQDNRRFWHVQYIFNEHSYIRFVIQILTRINPFEDNNYL